MKLSVMYRAQCFAAAAGYGPEYDVENIDVPTLIISISDTDTPIPNILAEHEKENPNIVHVEFLQFADFKKYRQQIYSRYQHRCRSPYDLISADDLAKKLATMEAV